MSDYIKREDALQNTFTVFEDDKQAVFAEDILAIPAADVREVKRGRWVKRHDDVWYWDGCYWYECSECGEKPPYGAYYNEYHSRFCPNCGAEMEETE